MLVRRTLPSTTSSLIQHQGFSRDDIGMISSCFATAYGCSKFMGAIISDHASARMVFACGLILSGLCSLLFPLASSVSLACVVWFVEGITQGLGWPPCVVLLKSWYPPSQIGRWWSILSSAGNISGALLPLIVVFITSTFHWSICYYLFGILSFGTGLLVMFTVRNSPADIGLGSLHEEIPSKHHKSPSKREENYRDNENSNDLKKSEGKKSGDENSCITQTSPSETKLYADKTESEERKTMNHPDKSETHNKDKITSKTSHSWYMVFFLPNLWVVSGIYAVLYLVNSCSQNWSQLYFVQEVGLSETTAATCYSMFQVGAIVGNLISGYISDLLVTPVSLQIAF